MKASNATYTQGNKTYTKLPISDFEKGQLSVFSHVGRWNHVVWDTRHQRDLSASQKTIRMTARRGSCLMVDGDYFVRM